MSEESYREVYRQLHSNQNKYIYFMLAAATSAIAYALNRAQDRLLTLSLIPWGLALILWGLSFCFGCFHLLYINSTLFANAKLIQIQRGEFPESGKNPELIKTASKIVLTAMEKDSDRASRFGHLQFWFFISGVFAYIAWQILEMYIRSLVP
jgi:hypothetical protein